MASHNALSLQNLSGDIPSHKAGAPTIYANLYQDVPWGPIRHNSLHFHANPGHSNDKSRLLLPAVRDHSGRGTHDAQRIIDVRPSLKEHACKEHIFDAC
jgi:hypothetical protein